MKKLTYLFILVTSFIAPYISNSQAVPSELTGVWQYELEGQEGISIISPTHAAWIILKTDREALKGLTITPSEKISAYDAIYNIAISTLNVDKAKRCSNTYIYSYNPSSIGQHFSWDYEIKGNNLTYWIIQADGTRSPIPGKARRLAYGNAKSKFSKMNGLWKYTTKYKGYYMHSGNYGIWLILDDPKLTVNSDEDKARAFDVLNAAAVIVQKVDIKQNVWRVLHAFNETMEKQSIYAGIQFSNPDQIEMWFADGFGNPIGDKVKVQRVK